MLDALTSAGLSDVVAVVTRYFGGVLLGAGGLTRAYRAAVAEAVLDGRAESVHPQVFTELDGLADREGNGGVQDAGIRLADGRLHATHGLHDLAAGVLRMNPLHPMPALFAQKARSYQARWPWLRVMDVPELRCFQKTSAHEPP